MSVIVPAILPKSHEDLLDKLSQLRGLTRAVQIDAVDATFAAPAPASWPYSEKGISLKEVLAEGLPHPDRMQYEVDLMCAHPEEVIGAWITAGATRITLHAESTPYLTKVLQEIQTKYGHDKDFAPDLLSIGLALNVNSELALIEPYIAQIDYVQFMGIARIGRQGEPFDTRVLQKIRSFRQKHPQIPIQVDGGVSLASAPELMRASVDRLIVGSALWKSQDLHEQFVQFNQLSQTYGTYE